MDSTHDSAQSKLSYHVIQLSTMAGSLSLSPSPELQLPFPSVSEEIIKQSSCLHLIFFL